MNIMLILFRAVFLDSYKPLPRVKTPPKYEAVVGGTPSNQYSTLFVTVLTVLIALLSTKF